MSQDEPRVPDPSPETSEARSKWAGPQLVAEVDKDDPDLASTTGDASSKRDTDSLLDIRMKLANVSSKGQSSQEIPAGQRIQLFQPRTKSEQFEDILLESHLLDSSAMYNLDESLLRVGAAMGGLNETETEELLKIVKNAAISGHRLDLEQLQESLNPIVPDFDDSDAIFNEQPSDMRFSHEAGSDSNEDEDPCGCSPCQERVDIEHKHLEELESLRQSWLELREDVMTVFRLVLEGQWSDNNSRRPDLTKSKNQVQKLSWRDPHQLFVRLEAVVTEFVLEIKLKLIELLQKQAKNPSLAENFIQDLLSGYEKLCSAANHLAPVIIDLEVDHLRRFSLSWEVLNKHLYQSLIYMDPLIQNNLPIFISQLRSLYPDKEHEEKYKSLVRGYLDFDVEMENIGEFWRTSEGYIQDFNRQQAKLRAKQKDLKEDWEKFKVQRKEAERQLRLGGESTDGLDGFDPAQLLGESLNCFLDSLEDLSLDEIPLSLEFDLRRVMHLASSRSTSVCEDLPLDDVDLEPSVQEIETSGSEPKWPSESLAKQSQSSSEGPESVRIPTKSTTSKESSVDSNPSSSSGSVDEADDQLSEALSTALTISSQEKQNNASKCQVDKDDQAKPKKTQGKVLRKDHHDDGPHSKEMKKLLHHHHCGGSQKQPTTSVSAVKRGKIPPPLDIEDVDEDQGSDDGIDDDSSCHDHEDCALASSNGQRCPCCYCEVFGRGGQTVAPVSRNYPEMRERLRLLLSKKKQKSCRPTIAPAQPERGDEAKDVDSRPSALQPELKAPQSPCHQMDTKDVDELLDYIEGNQKPNTNEKKRLKKERQKQQRLEELRQKQEAERKIKEAKEAERKRKEAEQKALAEATRLAEKKQKKKAAQKAKKAAAKGLPVPEDPAESAAALEELKMQQIREIQRLKLLHQQQLAEEERKLQELMQRSNGNRHNGNSGKNSNAQPRTKTSVPKNSISSATATGKGPQIRITRTASGGVEFTPVPESSSVPNPTPVTAGFPSFGVPTPQPPMPQNPGGLTFISNGQVPTTKPSVPSQSSPSQPMVTIRRVQTSNSSDSTVTISSRSKKNEDQLLYTLINGQVHRSTNAPVNLIPNAKPLPTSTGSESPSLSKKQRKKQQKKAKEAAAAVAEDLSKGMGGLSLNGAHPQQRLPLTKDGRVDLERLDLPPGISITKIEEESGSRSKRFPSLGIGEQQSLNSGIDPVTGLAMPSPMLEDRSKIFPPLDFEANPGGVSSGGGDLFGGYIANPTRGYPDLAGMNSSNVIVVDTAKLADEAAKDDDSGATGKKKNKKKKKAAVASSNLPQAVSNGVVINSNVAAPNLSHLSMAPDIPAAPNSEGNSLKSGPQVLIKNVNGRVVITPVPGTGATMPNLELGTKPVENEEDDKAKYQSGDKENIDDINSIFAPKDIDDLENGELDDDEREIEAFKRFCFNSVPLQQKPKVNFDVKNIALKNKK